MTNDFATRLHLIYIQYIRVPFAVQQVSSHWLVTLKADRSLRVILPLRRGTVVPSCTRCRTGGYPMSQRGDQNHVNMGTRGTYIYGVRKFLCRKMEGLTLNVVYRCL